MTFAQLSPYVSAALRHAITGAAGALVAVGAMSSDQEAGFVSVMTGIGVYAVGQAWSWWQKHQQAKALQGAPK